MSEPDPSWLELAIVVAALVLLALAAMVEAVAAVASRTRLRQMAEQRGRHRTVQGLLDPRRSLIAAVELVQGIAVAVAASLLTTMLWPNGGGLAHIAAVIVVVAVYLIFGQALPRAWAATQPERAAGSLVALAGVLAVLVRPLTAIGDGLAALWMRILPSDPDHLASAGLEEELRAAIEVPDDGIIEPEERAMIDNVLQLEETAVRDIMVPRVDIVAVEETAPAREIVETITSAGHSRVPVYRESIDQIVGVLYAKDLLPFVIGTTVQIPLARLLRPAFVVPESKKIDGLLTELRRNRVHIAIVADEYGGTAGLVTIEDIIEEIVGEIHDEYDLDRPLLETIAPGVVVVDGAIPLDEVEELLDVDLQTGDEEATTAAGFVHRYLERLPLEGDRFEAEGLLIEIVEVEDRRLRRLRLSRLDALEPPTGQPGESGPPTPAAASA